MDRSTRTVAASFLWIAALFIAMNAVVAARSPGDWMLFLALVVIGAVFVYLPDTRRAATETIGVEAVTLEEAEELSGPPTDSRPRSASAEVPSPVPETFAAPVSISKSPAATEEEEIVVTESRSDALAAVADPSDEELDDTVENVSTTKASTLEDTGELSGPPTDSQPRKTTSEMPRVALKPDDLTVIEGIGPKMSSALIAAGIDSFAKLAATNEDSLRAAIAAAGMRFAPSLVTWAEQAAYAAKGDWDGLKKFVDTLTAGRRVK